MSADGVAWVGSISPGSRCEQSRCSRLTQKTGSGNAAGPDMPTFENQKEESLTTEARKADNRGPTKGVLGSAVGSPTGVWGEAPADFYYGAI